MAGVTGLGTTYNLPNYTGILHLLSPTAVPLFSAIGGLTGGGQTTSTEFEWSAYDLRNRGQRVRPEGADAPTAEERVRGNITNVVQIQQETVAVSYTKLAAIGQKNGSNNDKPSNVVAELDWQVRQMLTQMIGDTEYSFLNGVYHKPSDNTTSRSTRGLIPAITTNAFDVGGAAVTGLSAATDTITETSTPLANDQQIRFTSVGVATAINTNQVYFVVSKTTNAFKVAETKGGAAITIGTATVAYSKLRSTGVGFDDFGDLAQAIYQSGGFGDGETATVIAGAGQKRAITKAYTSIGLGAPVRGNLGGVNVEQIETDFGIVNIMLSNDVPRDAIVCATLGELRPVYLEIPGKGHFFAEPLPSAGASLKTQIYGETGLEYGVEKHHGIIRGLPVPA